MKEGKTFTRRMHTMSIFYLMPPRPFLGDRLADFLHTLFPGLSWDSGQRLNLVELLAGTAGQRDDVFVIFREDLPRQDSALQALVDGFGAEAGDEVVEVRPGGRPGEFMTRRWRISDPQSTPIFADR
jgi:hypothetical protein